MKSKAPPPVKSAPPVVKAPPPVNNGKKLEFIVRVGLKEKPEPEEILVHEGDYGKDLCD